MVAFQFSDSSSNHYFEVYEADWPMRNVHIVTNHADMAGILGAPFNAYIDELGYFAI